MQLLQNNMLRDGMQNDDDNFVSNPFGYPNDIEDQSVDLYGEVIDGETDFMGVIEEDGRIEETE